MSIRIRSVILPVLLAAPLACDAPERAASGEEVAVEALPQGTALDPALEAHLPPGATFEEARLGHQLFTPCTVCHGPNAEGTQLGPSFRDAEWIHVEPQIESIAALIRTGVAQPRVYPVPMPADGGGEFDDAELRALAVYILTVSDRGEAR